jgi:cell division protein FtsW
VQIVKNVGTLFPALLVMGFLMNIMLQTLVNMLVAIGFMPVTGQPLPFVSMGGSSIVSTSIAVGIILNISRYANQKETVSEIEQDDNEMDEIVDYPFMAG